MGLCPIYMLLCVRYYPIRCRYKECVSSWMLHDCSPSTQFLGTTCTYSWYCVNMLVKALHCACSSYTAMQDSLAAIQFHDCGTCNRFAGIIFSKVSYLKVGLDTQPCFFADTPYIVPQHAIVQQACVRIMRKCNRTIHPETTWGLLLNNVSCLPRTVLCFNINDNGTHV